MDNCVIPVELFAMIATFEPTVVSPLRLTTTALAAIKLPIMIPLSALDGKTRHLIFTQHDNYKLQQLYTNGVLSRVRFGNAANVITIDTKRCLDNPMIEGSAGGKTSGDTMIASRNVIHTPGSAPRPPKIVIPRGNRARRSIHNGNVITYYFTTQVDVNTRTFITTRSLVHIKNINNNHQTYKIWNKNHYIVFEYDADWKLTRDVHIDSYTPI